MHVIQRKIAVVASGQHATPGIEDHNRLRTRFDLRIKVEDHAVCQFIQQRMQRVRFGIHHLFDFGECFAAAALNHIGCQRPRAAGKADQRNGTVEVAADGPYRIHHVTQLLLRIGHRQIIDVCATGNRAGEARTFAGFKIESQPHCIRDG